MPRSAEYLIVAVRRRIDHEPRVLYSANELADRNLRLQPRERTAETEVDAAAVAQVRVVLAFEVDLVRVREPVRVVPAISMSSSAVRVGQNWTDDSKRRNSSTPGTISSGRRRSFARASGCRSRVSTLWAIRLTVVSWRHC